MQHKDEFLWLWDHLPPLETVLEIGMGYGATAALFAFSGAQVTTIDPKVKTELYQEVDENEEYTFDSPEFKKLAWWAKPVRWIRKSSLDKTVISDVELPSNQKYDLLHIDGDHSPEVCRSDWETFSPMAKIVAIHDIYGWDNDMHWKDGPRGLWSELRESKQYKMQECCLHESGGMGLIWMS